jgi:outer membrane protein OmpA-like peptidoglycan-associated protein
MKIAEISVEQEQQAERIDGIDRRAEEGVDATWMAFAAIRVVNERALVADRSAMEAEARAVEAVYIAELAMDVANASEIRLDDRIAALHNYTPGAPKILMFEFDSDAVTPESQAKLDGVVEQIGGSPDYLIEVQGFTDGIGPNKYNVMLSEQRAESVMRYLVAKGVPLHRIFMAGLGSENPVSSNTTREGRERNRRVEVRVLWADGPVVSAER